MVSGTHTVLLKIEAFYPLEGILRLTNAHVHIDSGLQLSEYLYTCYKGIFMPFHMISVLINMCNELKSMYPPFLLILYSSQSEKPKP